MKTPSRTTRVVLPVLLIAVGLLQSLSYLLGVPALRGVGAALVASPLPLVFSHFRGLETFSSTFEAELTTRSGQRIVRNLDPSTYSLLTGPYNRRNVYGAVAAYGPALTEPHELKLRDAVMNYGFCKGPLAQTLGVDEPLASARLHVTNPYGREKIDSAWEVQCSN